MTDIVITADNLGKKYTIGHQAENGRYTTLCDVLMQNARGLWHKTRDLVQGKPIVQGDTLEEVWALKDVSFEVRRGEVVGIIGRNGAGKSTLLKILSRITEPSAGRVTIRGRVASLLEVGTGFHPELTGRENIYLNGTILGMTRQEIKRKFDEIVAFAEVEKFLDTPVKRYSSGMYVRLAFAVAAHLEPEILVVDEVLAVGDATFQKKCLGKMDEVAREGRTVIFVSHNMGAVQMLCHRAILLRYGGVLTDNSAAAVVAKYLSTLEGMAAQDLLTRTERYGQAHIRLTRIEISADESAPANILVTGRPACFVFHLTSVEPGLSCSFTIYNQLGQPITYFDSALHSQDDVANPQSGAKFLCRIAEMPLMPGRYRINAAIMHSGELQDHVEGAAFFEVEPGNFRGRLVPKQDGYGHVFVPHQWNTPR